MRSKVFLGLNSFILGLTRTESRRSVSFKKNSENFKVFKRLTERFYTKVR